MDDWSIYVGIILMIIGAPYPLVCLFSQTVEDVRVLGVSLLLLLVGVVVFFASI